MPSWSKSISCFNMTTNGACVFNGFNVHDACITKDFDKRVNTIQGIDSTRYICTSMSHFAVIWMWKRMSTCHLSIHLHIHIICGNACQTHTYVLWKDMSHTHRHGTTWRTRFRSRRCDQFRDTIGHLTDMEGMSSAQTNQACAIAPQTTRAPCIHVWTIVKMNAR